MRILITNDDGIHAPGLEVLEDIARTLGDDIWIVAPELEQSGQSRAISLTECVRVRALDSRRFCVRGTPTDCVLLALDALMPSPPDLILSGVNRGQNIAEDTSYSGTIAAALFGMQNGIASMALSQSTGFRAPGSCPWQTPRQCGPQLVSALLDRGWPENIVMNINFPDCEPDAVKGVQMTRQGLRDERILRSEKRTDLRETDYYWIGYRGKLSDPEDGTDLRAIYDGYISVSPLHADLTHTAFLSDMRSQWHI